MLPKTLTAGDAWSIKLDGRLLPGPGWTGAAMLFSWTETVTVPGVLQDDGGWLFEADASQTAAMEAGIWAVSLVGYGPAGRSTRGGVAVEVLPDPAAGSADIAYWVRLRDAVRATLEQRAADDQLEFQHAGRALKRHSLKELGELLTLAERRIAEASAKRRRNRRPARVVTRFVN